MTLTKKRRRKTEEEKKEILINMINMSKMKKLMKTRARVQFEYNRNDDEY